MVYGVSQPANPEVWLKSEYEYGVLKRRVFLADGTAEIGWMNRPGIAGDSIV